MTITTVFDAPLPTDSVTVFNTKSFDTVSKLNAWSDEANDTADTVNADAAATEASKVAAAASETAAAASELAAAGSANAASASAGATAWNAATNYTLGQRAWSLIDAQLYRRIVPGISATDPRLDQTNWARVWVEPEMVTAESLFFASL